jgi:hypothetical protein
MCRRARRMFPAAGDRPTGNEVGDYGTVHPAVLATGALRRSSAGTGGGIGRPAPRCDDGDRTIHRRFETRRRGSPGSARTAEPVGGQSAAGGHRPRPLRDDVAFANPPCDVANPLRPEPGRDVGGADLGVAPLLTGHPPYSYAKCGPNDVLVTGMHVAGQWANEFNSHPCGATI